MLRERERKKWNKERKHHLQGRQTEMSAGESLESCREKEEHSSDSKIKETEARNNTGREKKG